MLTYRHGFTGNGQFRTWMYHLARNLVYDYLKKSKKETFNYPAEAYSERMAGEYFADTAFEKKQDLETLERAMAGLSLENRELLLLCRYQELKYQEIAGLLGISEGAVKVRVHRALNQLKNCYLKIAN